MIKHLHRVTAILSCFFLLFQQAGLAQAAGPMDISGLLPASRPVREADRFRPVHLRSLSFGAALDDVRLVLDKGDAKETRPSELEKLRKELLDYFFIGLALPNSAFWVNLRPDSPDNIIDPGLAKTDAGRILLEADVQLKKDIARFTSPDRSEGKVYWERLYRKAEELFGSDEVAIPTLTRPWIVPGEIIIRESADSAYIYKATLKVMLEQDYLKGADYRFDDPRLKALNEYASQLIRELIIPGLVKEVNTSRRYAALRQVYYSLILAQWFKARSAGKENVYSRRMDSRDLSGLVSARPWSSETYYAAYRKSFSEGEYDIRRMAGADGKSARSYFSGGVVLTVPLPAGNAGMGEIRDKVTDVLTFDALEGVLPETADSLTMASPGVAIGGGTGGEAAPVAAGRSAFADGGRLSVSQLFSRYVLLQLFGRRLTKEGITGAQRDGLLSLVARTAKPLSVASAASGFLDLIERDRHEYYGYGYDETENDPARKSRVLAAAARASDPVAAQEKISRLFTLLREKTYGSLPWEALGGLSAEPDAGAAADAMLKLADAIEAADMELYQVFSAISHKGHRIRVMQSLERFARSLKAVPNAKDRDSIMNRLIWSDDAGEAADRSLTVLDAFVARGWQGSFKAVSEKLYRNEDRERALEIARTGLRAALDEVLGLKSDKDDFVSTLIADRQTAGEEDVLYALSRITGLDYQMRLRFPTRTITAVMERVAGMIPGLEQEKLAEVLGYLLKARSKLEWRAEELRNAALLAAVKATTTTSGQHALLVLQALTDGLLFSRESGKTQKLVLIADFIARHAALIDMLLASGAAVPEQTRTAVTALRDYKTNIEPILTALEMPDFLVDLVLRGKLDGILKEARGNLGAFVRLMAAADSSDYDVYSAFGDLIKAMPERVIASTYGVNIKLARFLKGLNFNGYLDIRFVLGRLADPSFREDMNDIAYNLNREYTLHPVERRVGEDEKNSLFILLFRLEADQLKAAREMFDGHFRNEPDSYKVELSRLKDLLRDDESRRSISISELRRIIRSVNDNPKQSLAEIISALKQQLENEPNAQFLLRHVEWIVSNLFVLQDRVEVLIPVAAAFEKAGKTGADLAGLLDQVDKAKKAADLIGIAEAAGLDPADLMRLKVESVSQTAREELILGGLQLIDTLPRGNRRDTLAGELLAEFDFQPEASRNHIYMRMLLSLSTDNTLIVKALDDLAAGREIGLARKNPFSREFIVTRSATVAGNALLRGYISDASAMPDSQRKAALVALRSVYQDSRPSTKGLDAGTAGKIDALKAQISLPQPQVQIPHIFYESLLKLVSGQGFEAPVSRDRELDILRQLIAGLNADVSVRDQLATRKNNLAEKIILLSADGNTDTKEVFFGILRHLSRELGPINGGNANKAYNSLMQLLEQYGRVVQTLAMTRNYAFPQELNDELAGLCGSVIDDLVSREEVNEARLRELADRLGRIEAQVLAARFKQGLKMSEEAAAGILEKFQRAVDTIPRFRSADYQGRELYKLMDIYISLISDEEVHRNMFDALNAEIDGRFSAWKYASPDYERTLDEIVDIELAGMDEEGQQALKDAIAAAPGATLREKLPNLRGFDGFREKMAGIMSWEQDLETVTGDGRKAVFAGDFITLFNIGNSSHFIACQGCAYGSDLNRGLSGYVSNGTNKAVALIDSKGEIITRRIVRLRVMTDDSGARRPVLLVEESTQFNSEGIDELYGVLETLSRRTGLPVVSSTDRAAGTAKVQSGKRVRGRFRLFPGRSSFDYSDLYGNSQPGTLVAGLYRQAEPLQDTREFDLLMKPVPASAATEGGAAEADRGAARDGGERKGGIDFRALPVMTQRMNEVKGTLDPAEIARLARVDIEAEYARISRLLEGGLIPSNERVREYALASCVQRPGKDMEKVLGCIAAILREEEAQAADTDPGLRDLLVLIEKGPRR